MGWTQDCIQPSGRVRWSREASMIGMLSAYPETWSASTGAPVPWQLKMPYSLLFTPVIDAVSVRHLKLLECIWLVPSMVSFTMQIGQL